ncbi:MAG: N-acetylmuramoyl-L-alanine amidase [Acidimicrobiales bacterium]|jgi:N-acetylmuramoyl-L-alanine amidase
MATSRHPSRAQASARTRGRTVRRRWRLFVLVPLLFLALGLAVSATWAGITRLRDASDPGVPVDPAAFATGSCVAYPPTSGDRHLTVFLDAGHGGLDPGAVGTTSSGRTIYEATETLPVELDTAALLRSRGYRVVVSRTTDSSVVRLTPADLSDGVLSLQGAHDDVAARDECANLAGADVLVGIYFDSGGSPDDAGSVTTYDGVRPFSAANLRLATLVQKDVLAAMNAQGWVIPDDGVQPDSQEGSIVPTSSDSPIAVGAAAYGHVLLLGPSMAGFFSTPSQMPGALVEPLFVTDPFEGSLAVSSRGQHVIAGGLATAIDQYFAARATAG